MNNFFKLTLLVLAFSFSINNSFAQEKYKTHVVKTGESVRSIAKEYNVTPYDFIKLNPDVSDPPAVGSKVIIPIPEKKVSKSVTDKPVVAKDISSSIEVVKHDGKNIFHKVEPKETLYSLSKKYNVEIKEIYALNPMLIDGLKVGMVLTIPQSEEITFVKRDTTKFIKHIIEPKETRWGICHKFGITEDALIENNPSIAKSVNIGDLIWIPKNVAKQIEELDDKDFNYTYYEVLPKDTRYGISKKFGVEIEVLKRENPNMINGLQMGMVLKIPKTPRVIYDTSKFEKIAYTNLPNDAELSSEDKIEELDKIDIPRVVDVVLMLPFYLDKNKEFLRESSKPISDEEMKNDNGIIVEGPKVYPKSAISLDFYNGAMYAIDSLKNMGLSVRLRVFDTKKDLSVVKQILDENDFSGVDVVIGPLYTKNVEYVADRLKYDNIMVVSPLSKKLNLDNRFNLVQAMPSSFTTKNSVVKEVIKEAGDSRIIIFGGVLDKPEVDFVVSRLKSSVDSNNVVTYIAKENLVKRNKVYKLLRKNKNNMIVIASKDEVLITDVITALNQVSDSIPNKAFLLNRPKVLDQLDSDYLNNVSLAYPEDYFVNYQNPKTVKFHYSFKKENNYYPTLFAYRGFDVTYDILYSLGKNSNLEVGILQNNKRCVQGKFNYTKTPFGGYYNDSVFILRYEDWKLTEVGGKI